jgi:hypothetical protein
MMLSQLTFRESESFDQGRHSEGGDCLISFVPLFAWCPFLFSKPPPHPEIKNKWGFFFGLLELRAKKNGISEMGSPHIIHPEASCAYT